MVAPLRPRTTGPDGEAGRGAGRRVAARRAGLDGFRRGRRGLHDVRHHDQREGRAPRRPGLPVLGRRPAALRLRHGVRPRHDLDRQATCCTGRRGSPVATWAPSGRRSMAGATLSHRRWWCGSRRRRSSPTGTSRTESQAGPPVGRQAWRPWPATRPAPLPRIRGRPAGLPGLAVSAHGCQPGPPGTLALEGSSANACQGGPPR